MFRRTLLVVLLCQCGSFQETNNITQLLTTKYKTNLNSSKHLEKQDQDLRNSWAVNFQVKRINVTTKYRLQMIRHKEHSFQRSDVNEKWSECMYLHRRQIRKSTKEYFADESECLTTITLEDRDSLTYVEKLEKEIRKWRRGYRYLVKTCKTENSDNEEAANACLVEYMEKDNYNRVIERLIQLKLEAMGKLYLQLNSGLTNLEECLKTQLFSFLENVRMTMDTLSKCYALKTQNI